MRQITVIIIIIVFLLLAYFLNGYIQKLLNPRKSFGRLMLYFLATIVMIAGLSYLMVFIIAQLFPQEILK
jgi:glycerol uptake facilitator-like aquaporin